MGRIKLGIAVVGVVIALLGVVALTTMRSGSSSDHATTVASGVSEDATVPVVTTVAPTTPETHPASPGNTVPKTTSSPATTKAPTVNAAPTVTVPNQPTPQDIQKAIAAITAEVLAPATSSASTAPLTKEQVEAQVREQMKKLGINF
jgi:hypothetical protein